MRLTRPAVIGLGLGLTLTGVLATAGVAQPALVQQTRVVLAPGVDHLTLLGSNPTNVIHVAHISANAAIAIKAVPAPATPSGAAAARPSDLCPAARALVCVNGDFYRVNGTPIGGELVDGRWIQQPNASQQQLWLDHNNRFSIGAMPAGVLQSLGATRYPILQNGRVGPIPEHSVFSDSSQARTLVGWNASGDSFFVTVDKGRNSHGMSLAEAGDLMLRLGATNAVNEDGGGSTQFVVGGAVANVPSYGPRPVANVWAVVPLPGSASFSPFVAGRAPGRP